MKFTEKLTEKNLMASYFNKEDGTCDLQFLVDDKTVWLRNAPFMEDAEIEEDYWTDEEIAYAIAHGAKIEEAE